MLGGRFSPPIGRRRATSWFADAGAAFDLGGGWGAHAGYRRGWTAVPGSGALAERGRLATDAWAFDLSKERRASPPGDRLALRHDAAARVRSGGFDLNMPVSYDYADGSVGYEGRFFNLAPTGREIDLEAAYGSTCLAARGHLSANAFVRREPGNVAAIARRSRRGDKVHLGVLSRRQPRLFTRRCADRPAAVASKVRLSAYAGFS